MLPEIAPVWSTKWQVYMRAKDGSIITVFSSTDKTQTDAKLAELLKEGRKRSTTVQTLLRRDI